jgi:hypothetical protein
MEVREMTYEQKKTIFDGILGFLVQVYLDGPENYSEDELTLDLMELTGIRLNEDEKQSLLDLTDYNNFEN